MKILNPKDAIQLADKIFNSKGFIRFAKNLNNTSYYVSKAGCPFRIRISDHKAKVSKEQLLVDLVFDYPTIENDVKTRVETVIKNFDILVKKKRIIKT